jgi:transcriptional regulator with XRE-family HTH domain
LLGRAELRPPKVEPSPFLPGKGKGTALGRNLQRGRKEQSLTQRQLAASCGLRQARISLLESGAAEPSLDEVVRLAEALKLPLQFFLSGDVRPGTDLADLAVELFALGVRDLLVGEAKVPGAFRPAEEVVATVLAGAAPEPRLVEALPAVLAWNRWRPPLLRAYGEVLDPRVPQRIAWLTDLTLTLHRLAPWPGGVRDVPALESYLRQAPPARDEDSLGYPASENRLPPVWRRWKINYAASPDTFRKRAQALASWQPS